MLQRLWSIGPPDNRSIGRRPARGSSTRHMDLGSASSRCPPHPRLVPKKKNDLLQSGTGSNLKTATKLRMNGSSATQLSISESRAARPSGIWDAPFTHSGLSRRVCARLRVTDGTRSGGRPRAAPTESSDYRQRHERRPKITDWMAQVTKDHPGLVTTVEYGQTYEKRTMSLLKIGLNTGEKKKAIWVDCGIHAREWIAPAFCQYFVREILQAYKTEPKMHEMMKNMDFYVTPVVNIDGYVYSWKDNTTRLWRKNRSPGPPGCICTGTDLNRNFDANWGTIGVSYNCCDSTYCGSRPVSEPEAQAITYFVGSRKEDFLCFLTIHSYGQLLLIPYGHPNFTASNYDELMEVGLGAADAIRKVHGMNYTVGTSPVVLYPNSGSSRDWSRMQEIPLTMTFELRDKGKFGFKLPEDQIKPACEEAYSGALHIITYAHDKAFSGTVATAAVTLWTTMLLAVGVTGNTLM